MVGKKKQASSSGTWSTGSSKGGPLVVTTIRKKRTPKDQPGPINPNRLSVLLQEKARMEEEIRKMTNVGATDQQEMGATNQPEVGASTSSGVACNTVSREIAREPDWKQLALDLFSNVPHVSTQPPQGHSILERPRFSDSFRENPLKFLEKFELFFQKSRQPQSQKLDEVMQCLSRRAEEWATANRTHWVDFQDFRVAFLSFFWSEARRQKIQMEILSRPFDPKRGLNVVDFFFQRFNRLSTLLLPMSTEDMVATIMRLMPKELQAVWSLVPYSERTLSRAQGFLAEQSQLESVERPLKKFQQTPTVSSATVQFNPFSVPPPTPPGKSRRTC